MRCAQTTIVPGHQRFLFRMKFNERFPIFSEQGVDWFEKPNLAEKDIQRKDFGHFSHPVAVSLSPPFRFYHQHRISERKNVSL